MAIIRKIKHLESKELGFGSRVTEPNQRLMNHDGTSNVRRTGLSLFESINFYHSLITMSWARFNLLVLLAYLTANIFFACIYMFAGANELGGMIGNTVADKFWEAFFFSAQTLTTVGYGRVNPVGHLGSSVAAIESMVGLLGFALATGLLYGRFSRPAAKILFSDNILVAPYRGGKALMFRIANKKKGEFTEPEVIVTVAYVVDEDGPLAAKATKEGLDSYRGLSGSAKQVRKFNNLNLELSHINILNGTWTVVHPIDENSPVSDWTMQDFENNQIEILVFVKGYDETFAQTVHTRSSYRHEDIIYGAKFKSATGPGPDGSIVVALDRINDYENVELPVNENSNSIRS